MLVWVKKLHPAFLKFGKNIAKVLLIGLLMPDQIKVSVSAFRTGSLSLIFYKLLFRVYLFFCLSVSLCLYTVHVPGFLTVYLPLLLLVLFLCLVVF